MKDKGENIVYDLLFHFSYSLLFAIFYRSTFPFEFLSFLFSYRSFLLTLLSRDPRSSLLSGLKNLEFVPLTRLSVQSPGPVLRVQNFLPPPKKVSNIVSRMEGK